MKREFRINRAINTLLKIIWKRKHGIGHDVGWLFHFLQLFLYPYFSDGTTSIKKRLVQNFVQGTFSFSIQ